MKSYGKSSTNKLGFEGFQRSSNASVSSRELMPPTLYHFIYQFIAHASRGIIVPVELADSHIRVYVHVQTDGLPDTARVRIKLQALDGSVDFTSKPVSIVAPETLRIEIPQVEIIRFSGKEVAIIYVVELADEEPVDSPKLFVRVTLPIVSTPPVVEGLIDSKIKASDYPNGLNVDLAAIENLESSCIVSCAWTVKIEINGSIIGLYELTQRAPATPGAAYCFRIPVEAYVSWPANAIGICTAAVDFAPHDPNLPTYGVGGHEFSFI
jgi:hypothetical protein